MQNKPARSFLDGFSGGAGYTADMARDANKGAARLVRRVSAFAVGALLAATHAEASNVGRRLPSEKRTTNDAVTGARLTFLTTDAANDSKPYQTDPTWTADGKWILLRTSRGDSGPQAFLLNEETGDIIQATEGVTNTGSLTLSRKTNRMFVMRPGPPRQIVEISLDPLIADSLAGAPKPASAYERVVATLPSDTRTGGLALDADESRLYFGVSLGPPPPPRSGGRRDIDDRNMDPDQDREASRQRFEQAGKGQSSIRSVDMQSGQIKTVIDVPFRMGHLQTNPWVPGEILYCHETTGDAPQRMWTVRADGTGNRPLYVESPDEWVTHETFSGRDEVMFNLMGHLPYQREKPTGLAVINLRSNHMTILDQIDEDLGGRRTGGLWHGNGSPDGKWAVGDSFKGNVYLIDRRNGERILLTTDHRMRPDHAHPIFSPDSKRVLIQSGQLTDGRSLDLVVVDIPAALLSR
jgi:oligogalacturonide lyase